MSKDHSEPSSRKPKKATAKLDKQQEELKEQLTKLTAALQQERADAINLRRRHEEEIASLRTRLKADVVRDLLPVIDNFERAIRHHPKPELESLSGEGDKTTEWIRGVSKTHQLFEKTLADMGVERIKTVGERFDPHLHEAISMEEGDGDDEIVSEELQAGYKIGSDIIRHAIVRVSLKK